ncbi:hypothetical protein Tco_0162115, partial [Tanacetum coccineum]
MGWFGLQGKRGVEKLVIGSGFLGFKNGGKKGCYTRLGVTGYSLGFGQHRPLARGYKEHDGKSMGAYCIEVRDDAIAVGFMYTPHVRIYAKYDVDVLDLFPSDAVVVRYQCKSLLARGYAEHDDKRIGTYFIEVCDDVVVVGYLCMPHARIYAKYNFNILDCSLGVTQNVVAKTHVCIVSLTSMAYGIGRCSEARYISVHFIAPWSHVKVYSKHDGDGS